MSVLDEIRKLDEQKATLLATAKKEALATINASIATLNELGYSYTLTEGGAHVGSAKSTVTRAPGTRRAGIRDTILNTIKHNPGVTRSALIELMDAKGDKSAEQSISNALSALKKAGDITAADGAYTAV